MFSSISLPQPLPQKNISSSYSSDLTCPRSVSLRSARRSPSPLRLARSSCLAVNLGRQNQENFALCHVLAWYTTSRGILQYFRCCNIFQPCDVEVKGVGQFRNALWARSIEARVLCWGWAWEGWKDRMIGAIRDLEASWEPLLFAFKAYLPTSITTGPPQDSHCP